VDLMIEKQYPVTLDLVKKLQTGRIEFVRGDMKTCILLITLKNNDAITVLTGLNVQFFLKKSDGTKVVYDSRYDVTVITITDFINGIIKVILPLQAIAAIGFGKGQISIIDGNTAKATSQEFPLYVRDGWDSDLVSMDEVPVLQKLISDVNALQQQTDDAELFRSNEQASWRTDETARDAAEIIRASNASINIIAEGNRITAEALRIINNTTATTAEAGRVAAEILRASQEATRQAIFIVNEASRGSIFSANELSRQGTIAQFQNWYNTSSLTGKLPYFIDGGDYGDASVGSTYNGGDY
jgi:hypothetical protein